MRKSRISATDLKKVNTLKLVLIFSFVLLVIKFLAWYITRSNAILTDALESIVNVIAGGFALFSIYFASLPRDENHPYGHGKIEFISAGFEGGLILVAGGLIIVNATLAFFKPPVIQHLEAGVWLSAFSGAVNLIMGYYLVKTGNKNSSDLMVANGKHLMTDTVSSIGLVAGLWLIILTGYLWIDHVLAILFGSIIIGTGFGILKKSVNSLLDEADYEKLYLLIQELQKHRKAKWIDIHNLRVIKYGSNLHVDCHITLPWYDTLEAAHSEVNAVEQLIGESLGKNVEFFIHADPCLMPTSCSICQITECVHRQAPFQKKIIWDITNMLPNRKHQL